MKGKNLSKILNAITTIIMLTLITIGILLLVVAYINAITEPEIIAEVVESETTISKLDDGSSHPKGEFVSPEGITSQSDNAHVPPAFFGTQSYCVEPGVGTDFDWQREMEGGSNFTREQYMSLMSKGKYHSDCIKKQGHATNQIPFLSAAGGRPTGTMTQTYYRYAGTEELSPALAYIISSNENDTSDEEVLDKQHAMWNLRGTGYDNGLIGTGNPIDDPDDPNDGDQPSKYDDEAKKYSDFYSSVNSAGGRVVSSSFSGSVAGVKVNTETQEYIVGPFSVPYIDASPFSGVSNMYCVGYNLNGTQVKSNIKIERIITQDKVTGTYKGNGTAPNFFDADSNDQKIDREDRNYPRSEQGFYIVIKDPNKDISDDSMQRVVSVAVKMQFQWMETKYSADLYEGVHYHIMFDHQCGASPYHYDVVRRSSEVLSSTNCSHPNCTTYPAAKDEDGNTISWVHVFDITEQDTGCDVIISGEEVHDQNIILPKVERIVHTQEVEIGRSIPFIMDIGGTVWEENFTGKESLANGLINSEELLLKNIKVTLYTQDGIVAKLLPVDNGINSILTDINGEYKFNGLNPMKKYYVTFEYDGQIYIPSDYLSNSQGKNYSSAIEMINDNYNQKGIEWQTNSKATEKESERNGYNDKFASIGSYPENYVTSNSLGYLGANTQNKVYNTTFSRLDLMGYTLGTDGNYKQTGLQLIDGYLYDSQGLSTTQYSDGIISTKIREFINKNKRFPNNSEIAKIYSEIANGNIEVQRKLQFIEDCKIIAYTKSPKETYDLYPARNQFVLGETSSSVVLEGKIYGIICPDQHYINLGLQRRQETDISLRKDVYKAALTINGQSHVYKYDDRGEDDKYWSISARISDYESYYNSTYNRSVYSSDANADLQNVNNKRLDIYVTYKITVRNASRGVMTQIDEVVDYYDQDFEFMPNMSWVMYENEAGRVPDKDYLSIIEGTNISATNNPDKYKPVQESETGNYSENTRFKLNDSEEEYQSIYINGLKDYKLSSGENEYIYLTFKLKRDSNNKLLLDDENSTKQNIAEINGYTTWYNEGTKLPNGIEKGSNDHAGIIDQDSNPGNFNNSSLNAIENGMYEHNMEDDTDRAKGIKIYEDKDLIRKISGITWEDKRTYSPEGTNALIGNGVKDAREVGINGITVNLYEVLKDGKVSDTPAYRYENGEWINSDIITNTVDGKDGFYQINGYIPGDYIVRFIYNGKTYNAQDYKSTSYQINLDDGADLIQLYEDKNNLQTDISMDIASEVRHYFEYENPNEKNGSAEYGYNISKADEYQNMEGKNVSDAKDIWSIRKEVNSKYANSVTNKGAVEQAEGQKLADGSTKYEEMIAETGVIRVEVEYNRETSTGDNTASNNSDDINYAYGNDKNGTYHIQNLDFGLEERPKAGLELNKQVSNVKITLANGAVQFDATQSVEDLIWQAKTPYNIDAMKNGHPTLKDGTTVVDEGPVATKPNAVYSDYTGNKHELFRKAVLERVATMVNSNKGLIQVTMDEEIMHGATITITYDMTVTNIGEEDYNEPTFYYKGNVEKKENIVKTVAEEVIDYVANNLQYRESNNTAYNEKTSTSGKGWRPITQTKAEEYLSQDAKVAINKKYNTILMTTGLSEQLVPVGSSGGKSSTETKLVLMQTITAQNTSDDLQYKNIAEIVSISNDVGRRMAYSIQGNQDPTKVPTEPDASMAEDVTILPPFGTHYLYIGLSLFIITLIAVSIIVIKRTVLR